MNAALQCLSNTYELTEFFLYKYIPTNDNNKIMANTYYNLLLNLWDVEKNSSSYSPDSFKEVLSKENPLFAGIAANDSKDLINFLIGRFHEELNEANNSTDDNNNNTIQQDQTNEQITLKYFIESFKKKNNQLKKSFI
jgi:ubiquitin carboxyl-terminal hydrolase 4/11/15